MVIRQFSATAPGLPALRRLPRDTPQGWLRLWLEMWPVFERNLPQMLEVAKNAASLCIL